MPHEAENIWENIQIAKPCKAKWDQMSGDEKVRACNLCKMNVYNVAMMTKEEAEQLFAANDSTGTRTCIRLWRRADGTIITRNCPKALQAIKVRIWSIWASIAAVIGGMYIMGMINQDRNCIMGERMVEKNPVQKPTPQEGQDKAVR